MNIPHTRAEQLDKGDFHTSLRVWLRHACCVYIRKHVIILTWV